MTDRSKGRAQKKCVLWSFKLVFGLGAKDPTPERLTVTKPQRRSRPKELCSTSKEGGFVFVEFIIFREARWILLQAQDMEHIVTTNLYR
jgi:hypothetical protein